MKPGKSIDDVLIYNDKLVLVDNIIYPKYLFEYDISDSLAPVATKTIKLPNNGTYEHIYRGSINSRWMALLSGGMGREGSSKYVSVFSLPGYEQVFTVYLKDGRDFLSDEEGFTSLEKELQNAENNVGLYDFAIAGDNLLIACGHHGLGIFPLQKCLESYREEKKRSEDEKLNDPETIRYTRVHFGASYNLSGIYKDMNYLNVIEQLEDIHKLVPLPNDNMIAVSYGETNRRLDYKVFSF
jgi:hypothetical protein